MQDEPTYEFQKGIGWVPVQEEYQSCIREYEGRKYKVTVIKRQPKTTERAANGINPYHIGWWPDWNNGKGEFVPAGFGFAITHAAQYYYTVLTELVTL